MKRAAVSVALLILGTLTACGGSPPQIVDYSPERGAKDVSTAAPIRITFDHNVDQASVESRLALSPTTPTTVRWVSGRQLLFQHSTLEPNTTYEVVLEEGYKDLAGNAYALRHHWSFVTEPSPSLAGATPADREAGVDPASYLALEFTRDMNPTTLAGAITITPSVAFSVRLDPTDGRRAIVAPDSLLEPSTVYTVSVSTAALDAHGNALDRPRTLAFSTGPARPLRHWVAFTTGLVDGTSTGVWIVNEAGFPRRLFGRSQVQSFSWSPEGSTVLVQVDGLAWAALTPGEGSVSLAFRATWAGTLAATFGYAFIDSAGALHRWSADGIDDVIADNVSQASVAPNGQRVAYVQSNGSASDIWAYDVGLRARYQLSAEAAPVTDLSWAPAGNRLAYLRHDPGALTLRIRNLTGTAATTTIATGELGRPAWLPDSAHVVFAARAQTPGGATRKAFLVSVVAPPVALSAALALPSDPSVDVTDPVPSPDGHQIAFVSGSQIWIMNADGTRPTPLTRFDAGSFPYSCEAPAWTRL